MLEFVDYNSYFYFGPPSDARFCWLQLFLFLSYLRCQNLLITTLIFIFGPISSARICWLQLLIFGTPEMLEFVKYNSYFLFLGHSKGLEFVGYNPFYFWDTSEARFCWLRLFFFFGSPQMREFDDYSSFIFLGHPHMLEFVGYSLSWRQIMLHLKTPSVHKSGRHFIRDNTSSATDDDSQRVASDAEDFNARMRGGGSMCRSWTDSIGRGHLMGEHFVPRGRLFMRLVLSEKYFSWCMLYVLTDSLDGFIF